MTKWNRVIIFILLLIGLKIQIAIAANNFSPRGRGENYYAQAENAFKNKKYAQAVKFLKKYLRRNPRDVNAKNFLGASFYQTGLPASGLKKLKSVEGKSQMVSFNFFYQGLCLRALADDIKAREAFQKAASVLDEYGSFASFELAVLEYENKNFQESGYWFQQHIARFPSSPYRKEAERVLQSMTTNKPVDKINGVEKPDSEKAFYKFHPYSLFPYPHFWHWQIGGFYGDKRGLEPGPGGATLKEAFDEKEAVTTSTGIGIGPVRAEASTIWGGYTYKQFWYTDGDRFSTYFEDATDLSYQPFRADLLERRHIFYGDFRRNIFDKLYGGLYGKIEFRRIGASYIPGPEATDIRKTLKIEDLSLLIPWLGVTYYENFRSLIYLYFRKSVNAEAPEHSSKSFLFNTSEGLPSISYGLNQGLDFPDLDLSINLDAFLYEFVYNDPFLDYKRTGAIIGFEQEFIPTLFAKFDVGYYNDKYILSRFKNKGCTTVSAGDSDSAPKTNSGQPQECPRDDSGYLVQGSLNWEISSQHRLSFQTVFIQNNNELQKEFEEQKIFYFFNYTMAFPDIKRVTRFTERFADSAFTKDPQ